MFREDGFSSRSIEIGRHLLTCKECRAKLPSVTPQEFRNCILGADSTRLDESEPKYRFFDFPVFSFARVTAFAGFAILLSAGLYFVGVQRFDRPETNVARSDNRAVPSGVDLMPVTSANPTTGRNEDSPVKNAGDPKRDPRLKSHLPKASQRNVEGVTASGPNVQHAETRGSENPCSGGATITIESTSDGKEVFLRWNSVKGAESYDIYISDLDENLVDHFESKSQTYYRSTVKFDSAQSYRWKLIITLKNGNRIVGPPQVIMSGTTSENSMKPDEIERKRGSFELRCVSPK